MEEIWITGLGMVTSIGIGREAFWSAALEGLSGAIHLEHPLLETDQFSTQIGAPVKGFDPVASHIPAKDVKLLDKVSQYALAAAFEAIEDAGLELELINPKRGTYQVQGVDGERLGVTVGSGIGGLSSMVEGALSWHDHRRRTKLNRYNLPMVIPNAPAAQVAIRLQAKAECKAISTACAAGTMAIGDAYRTILTGDADVMVCGGAESVLPAPELYGLMGFDLLKTMSKRNDDPKHASRPFDKERDGFVLADGAGILVLERASHARARGVKPYARLAGYASTCDAASMMAMDPSAIQIERAMCLAIERADLSTRDVQYVNAHGTSTKLNDRVESGAIRRLFSSHSDALAVSSTKSMTGHSIAASGAIEAIATALTLQNNVIPPTINLENPDPECNLDYVPNQAREGAVHAALSNSFGFGGHNACLVFAEG